MATYIFVFCIFFLVANAQELNGRKIIFQSEYESLPSNQFRYPIDCSGENCDYFGTWTTKEERIAFTISAKVDSNEGEDVYLAVGFNSNPQMGGASVVDCIHYNDSTNYRLAKNEGYNHIYLDDEEIDQVLFTNSLGSQLMHGYLTCAFQRRLTVDSSISDYAHDLSAPNEYYLILATGRAGDINTIGYHSSKVISEEKISFARIDKECQNPSNCIRFPTDCMGDGCDYIASWENNGAYAEFTVSAKVDSSMDQDVYLAIGLNEFPAMDGASVVDCIHYNGTTTYRLARNEGYSHKYLDNEGVNGEILSKLLDIDNSNGQLRDGYLTCRFQRLTKADDNMGLGDNFHDLSVGNDYYMLLALGTATSESTIGYHASKVVSQNKITFGEGGEATTYIPFTTEGFTESSRPVSSLSPDTTIVPSPDTAAGLLQEGCGDIKGCYMSPLGCVGEECDFIVTYRARGDFTDFEVYTKMDMEDMYVSIGFNEYPSMGGASVVDCIHFDGQNYLQFSYNDGYSNRPIDASPAILEKYSFSSEDGSFVCKFSRKSSIVDQNESSLEIFNLTSPNKFHLLAAKGSASGPGSKLYHSSKVVSEQKIDFNAIRVSQGSTSAMRPFVKAHGILMIVSWMLLAGFGLLNARYFKNEWADQSIFGLKFWFINHRTSMQIATVASLAGFVLIFVHVGGWSEVNPNASILLRAHPYIGVIVTFFVILNPIMAVFRPDVHSESRVIFNWAHRVVGTLSFVLAILNIFLGLYLPGVEEILPLWVIYIMIGYASYHILTEIILMVIVSQEKMRPELDNPTTSTAVLTEVSVDKEHCKDQEILTRNATEFSVKTWILRAYLVVTLSLVVCLLVVFVWPPARFQACSTNLASFYEQDFMEN